MLIKFFVGFFVHSSLWYICLVKPTLNQTMTDKNFCFVSACLVSSHLLRMLVVRFVCVVVNSLYIRSYNMVHTAIG